MVFIESDAGQLHDSALNVPVLFTDIKLAIRADAHLVEMGGVRG
jgi:hypothetical protein